MGLWVNCVIKKEKYFSSDAGLITLYKGAEMDYIPT